MSNQRSYVFSKHSSQIKSHAIRSTYQNGRFPRQYTAAYSISVKTAVLSGGGWGGGVDAGVHRLPVNFKSHRHFQYNTTNSLSSLEVIH